MNIEGLNEFERRLRQRLRDRWDCPAPEGFSAQEIEAFPEIIASTLPEVYLRFLSVCGLQAGRLFRGYHWNPSSRSGRNTELRQVCDEFDLKLPSPVFCFLDYIGDYFWCFALSDDANPVVMRHDTGVQWLTLPLRLDAFLLTWEQHE